MFSELLSLVKLQNVKQNMSFLIEDFHYTKIQWIPRSSTSPQLLNWRVRISFENIKEESITFYMSNTMGNNNITDSIKKRISS